MTSTVRPPTHESLHVVDTKNIYRNEEWWKAVVRYKFDQSEEYDEIAVYLWHNDDGWTRKTNTSSNPLKRGRLTRQLLTNSSQIPRLKP